MKRPKPPVTDAPLPKWEPAFRLYTGPEMYWRDGRPVVQRPMLAAAPRTRQAWRTAAQRRAAGQP